MRSVRKSHSANLAIPDLHTLISIPSCWFYRLASNFRGLRDQQVRRQDDQASASGSAHSTKAQAEIRQPYPRQPKEIEKSSTWPLLRFRVLKPTVTRVSAFLRLPFKYTTVDRGRCKIAMHKISILFCGQAAAPPSASRPQFHPRHVFQPQHMLSGFKVAVFIEAHGLEIAPIAERQRSIFSPSRCASEAP